MSAPLLRVEALQTHFPIRSTGWFAPARTVRAVDGVSFALERGETLGLVGESGCGKSTLGRSVLRLVEPTSGRVHFREHEVTALAPAALRALRPKMQIIFQDPYSSLDPRYTVHATLNEALQVRYPNLRGSELDARIEKLLERVGLRTDQAQRYPHEFSGGQRQRIGIARALAVEPEFIVADEPISALDVSIQAQVVNLLKDLQDELGIAYLFIAHDLKVVQYLSRRVAVMYLGRIVELASSSALYEKPAHPYTRALLSAVPVPDPEHHRNRILLQGEPPSPIAPPSGCSFHPRCAHAKQGLCDKEIPPLRLLRTEQLVACHRAEELEATS